MIEMAIDSIRVSLMNYQRVVILKEKLAERYLPIWIGPAEADAIAVKLQGVTVPRPLTHDLLHSTIDALGDAINCIIVSDLKNDTFFAKIVLNVDGGQMEVDSRPSDALALAVEPMHRYMRRRQSWIKRVSCWTRKPVNLLSREKVAGLMARTSRSVKKR